MNRIKKIALCTIGFTSLLKTGYSQNFEWAKQLGGPSTEYGNAIAVDAAGNVYTTGIFYGTVDFDPSASTFNLTSAGNEDVFISKLDAHGNFLWAKQLGGTDTEISNSIVVDAIGNVFTVGRFTGTTDFDPGIGTVNLTSLGSRDAFVSKLDASGNFVWAKQLGGMDLDQASSITVDATGNVYIAGSFGATADFDPGIGNFNLTSVGFADNFVTKLDASGNFLWAKQFGGASGEYVYSITLDGNDNVLATGLFIGTADFDPSAVIFNLTAIGSRDAFVSKFDASGNFVWAKQLGGVSEVYGNSIAVDINDNVYTTGYFYNTVDFDPGSATFNLTSSGMQDVFVSKLDASGNFIWAKQLGGPISDYGQSIAVDVNENVYTTGYFYGTTDFDPGSGTFNLTSQPSNYDIFISKLDALGNFSWAKQLGGSGYDFGNGIAVVSDGSIVTTGGFESTVDFDPNAGTYSLTAVVGNDIFIHKMSCSTYSSISPFACGSYTSPSGNNYTTSGTYTDTIPNVAGCDSIITINLTVSSIADQTVNATLSEFCDNGSTTITTSSSQIGVNYYLRNDASNAIVDGPISGTGSALSFNTGTISSTTSYNVYAEKPNDFGLEFSAALLQRAEITSPYTTYGNTMTVEAWVYLANPTGSFPWMGQSQPGADNMSTNVWIWHALGAGNEFTWYVNDNGSWRWVNSTGLTGATGWHHIATVADASSIRIYIDGVLNATGPGISSGIRNSAASAIHVGNDPRLPLSVGYHGNFTVSEFRLWNNARTASQIATNMNDCLIGNETGLQHYNKFNTNTGMVAIATTGPNANLSASMNPLTDWVMGNEICESTCTAEMTQTVTVTVKSSTSGTDVQTACDSFNWIDGNTYTSSTNTPTHTLTNANGCDSIVTLNLTILNSNSGTDVQTACDSYSWIDGNTYTSSTNTPTHTLTNVNGCDSIVTLNLTILNSNSGTDVQTACNSYTWIDGNTYTSSTNTPTHILSNVAGCDSIVTLNLTINTVDVTVNNSTPNLAANATGATYQWIDCGNGFTSISGATNQNFTATTNGDYAVVVTQNGCTDTSTCVTINNVGIEENTFGDGVNVYPNPTNGNLTIELGAKYNDITVKVKNTIDQQIGFHQYNEADRINLSLDAEKGIYFIEIVSESKTVVLKVIKI